MTPTGDWRDFRPAIWLVMLGIAALLLFKPWLIAVAFFGAAIGVAIKVYRGRRRARPGAGKTPG